MSELVVQSGALMPVMDVATAITRRKRLVGFVRNIMVSGIDYGAVPGTDKDTLLKPGAEKLSTFFGLTPRYEIVQSVEQWDSPEPLFYYLIRCRLYHGDLFIGEADGSCNSRESRYRWRWVDESDVPPDLDKNTLKRRGGKTSEYTFAVDEAKTSGKYSKPPEYWQAFKDAIADGTAKKIKKPASKGRQFDAWEIDRTVYRVPNEDIFSLVNTVLKMAEKRALVAAVLVAVNASEFFTQDMEDLDAELIDVQASIVQPMPEAAAEIDHAAELAEAKREGDAITAAQELGFEDGIAAEEPPTARRTWPAETVQAVMDANLAKPAKHVIHMLNLSGLLATGDDPDLVVEWAGRYRKHRDAGADAPGAAKLADMEMSGVTV